MWLSSAHSIFAARTLINPADMLITLNPGFQEPSESLLPNPFGHLPFLHRDPSLGLHQSPSGWLAGAAVVLTRPVGEIFIAEHSIPKGGQLTVETT